MKICPHPSCGKEHNKPGKFCCRSCANARVFSEETKRKQSIASKKWAASLSPEQRAEINSKISTSESRTKANDSRLKKYSNMDWEDLPIAHKKNIVRKDQNFKCISCELDSWMGKPLILEVDHVDGNTENNSRLNLRAMCPNCHSQTPTWRKGFKNKQPADDAILKAYYESSSMSELLDKLNLKWGSFVGVIKSLEKSGIRVY